MHQVLLIEQNSDLSKVIKLNMMKAYDFEVIEKQTVSDAIDLIEILPDISLIIIRDVFYVDLKVKDLVEFLQNSQSKIPLLIIGNDDHKYKNAHLLDAGLSWKVLVDIAGKILGVSPFTDYRQSNLEYVPIPIIYFMNIHETSIGCDVYIRVRKSESEFQYIKRLNSKDYFERTDIEKYQQSGLKEFFIPNEHFPQFVNYVSDKLTLQLSDKKMQTADKLQLGSEVFEVTLDRIHSLGIDDRTVELVTESIKTMQSTLGSDNALSSYLNLLMQNKLGFNYAHSYLTCLLLHKIIKNFDWESNLVRDKITYISYFHDIGLLNEEYVKIHSQEELENLAISTDQKNIVLGHALKSSEIVEKFPQIPMGVGPLIREHHGIKSGVGFATSLSIALSPLSMMFIVVEHFVHEFLKIPGVPTKVQLDAILKKLEGTYTKVTYAQTLLALQNTISRK
jgi:hypothetical protein